MSRLSRLPFGLQLALIILGSIAIGLAGIIIGGSFRSAPTVAPTPATVVVVAPTPAPPAPTVAAPPQPTAAPAKPASAPAKPEPKTESKPAGLSAESQAYVAWANPKIEVVATAMGGMGQQLEQAGANPRLIADDTWKIRTATALAVLKTTGQELQAYPGPVPESGQRLNELLKGAGADLVFVSDEFIAGLDQGNVARINSGTNRMLAANQKIRDARAELDKLR